MTDQRSGMRLELLSVQHRPALEDFERDNRAFFAQQVGDRGNDYFAHFGAQLAERVRENTTGQSLLCVVIDEDGAVIARINVLDIDSATPPPELGYRVAEAAQGKGVATWGVTGALELAAAHGVRRVRARVATTNPASRRVLEHCGFTLTGPADAPAGSTKSFLGYHKEL